MNSSTSFTPLAVRSLRESGLMPVRSSVGLACKLVVTSVRQMTTIFDLRKVVDVVDDCCMMGDRVDRCSSKILHAAKDCYLKRGYYNNLGMDTKNLVIPIESVVLMDVV